MMAENFGGEVWEALEGLRRAAYYRADSRVAISIYEALPIGKSREHKERCKLLLVEVRKTSIDYH